MHHYKAPHDYFDNAPRYESYLANADIPSRIILGNEPQVWVDCYRGDKDELVPHIGTSIGGDRTSATYNTVS